ncbi:Uma2 family endonuclease [Rhodoferax sp. 4810]|uniref:Uma2 family endonuclease n=1 Tax=Thiospirillum jenense TaxID=1653858 RepID=A0A839HCC0_9GAMM|nr:Uma2 family endonuclease [Thiospirillum jenense]MBB1078025.1 Uma2 family endonuclease [Rhodoferax jenense]MBB1126184.1 Uma2 family endonuclease [Thiospirillum jenense]
MHWQEVCNHPALHDLPFKIELNEWGQVLMSPVKVRHSALQGAIARALPASGVVLLECAIATTKGTRVADVAWCSAARFQQIHTETECSIAPEVCIEVISAGNTAMEMREKTALYFAAGALEVWLCNDDGVLQYFNPHGQLTQSHLIPTFPQRVIITPPCE